MKSPALLLIFAFLLVLFVGCTQQGGTQGIATPPPPTSPPPASPLPSQPPISAEPGNAADVLLTALISGCAETDTGTGVKAAGEWNPREPKLEVIGSEIKYSRALIHLCCRQTQIEKETDGSTINIFEVWSGVGCKCQCFSEIEATVGNIPAGSYTVNVYETGTEPGDGGEPMEQKLIVTENISIP